jgi:hypothetical protein
MFRFNLTLTCITVLAALSICLDLIVGGVAATEANEEERELLDIVPSALIMVFELSRDCNRDLMPRGVDATMLSASLSSAPDAAPPCTKQSY